MIESNFSSFVKEFTDELDSSWVEIKNNGKEIAYEALRLVQVGSPKDKGRFQASHVLTINHTDESEEAVDGLSEGEYANIMNTSLQDGLDKLISHGIEDGDTIYIQNNLSYAEAIEEGHSQQAPSGLYSVTMEYMRRRLI